ncbi:hypothetical protein GCM10011369_23400 [Neiella marina]|uniref:Uncharacterized protein n=1 Tax=Neiella marina TaxID=508461 RepID=A0A8J2U609_9GAMM|nr:hypothetical protein [Neiella marina]GGA80762.1 hypothetical protein GCM10011369_23400 [Neiella marina]
MSLSDDLNADLANVFFADFNDTAVIKGAEVVGFLDVNAYQWADIDSNQHIFITAFPMAEPLNRGDKLTIAGQSYKYVTKRQHGSLLHVILAKN